MCLHTTYHSESDTHMIYIRRFFSIDVFEIQNILISLEVGEMSGMIVSLQKTFTCFNVVSVVVSGSEKEMKVIEIPNVLLSQMIASNAVQASSVEIQMTIQINYTKIDT